MTCTSDQLPDMTASADFNRRRSSLALSWTQARERAGTGHVVDIPRILSATASSGETSVPERPRRPSAHRRTQAVDLNSAPRPPYGRKDLAWHLEEAAQSGLKLDLPRQEVKAGANGHVTFEDQIKLEDTSSMPVDDTDSAGQPERELTDPFDDCISPCNTTSVSFSFPDHRSAVLNPLCLDTAPDYSFSSHKSHSSCSASSTSTQDEDRADASTSTSPVTPITPASSCSTPFMTPPSSPTMSMCDFMLGVPTIPTVPLRSSKRDTLHDGKPPTLIPTIKAQALTRLSPRPQLNCPSRPLRSHTDTRLSPPSSTKSHPDISTSPPLPVARLGEAGLISKPSLDSWTSTWDAAFDSTIPPLTLSDPSDAADSDPRRQSPWRRQSARVRRELDYQVQHKCGDGRSSAGVAPLATGVVTEDPMNDLCGQQDVRPTVRRTSTVEKWVTGFEKLMAGGFGGGGAKKLQKRQSVTREGMVRGGSMASVLTNSGVRQQGGDKMEDLDGVESCGRRISVTNTEVDTKNEERGRRDTVVGSATEERTCSLGHSNCEQEHTASRHYHRKESWWSLSGRRNAYA